MTDLTQKIAEQLYQMQDAQYREFQSALLPTVDKCCIIGVRVPQLRKLARDMIRSGDGMRYLRETPLPHAYYDENNLHAFLIEGIQNYDDCIAALERFLPYVDNWATCDMMAPKILMTQPERFLGQIQHWLQSDAVYTIRFGMVQLMKHYLDTYFTEDILRCAAAVRQDNYYLRMASAWFFAEALVKQYDAAVPYITEKRLHPETHNKAIQKARESRRLSDTQKEYLKTWKIQIDKGMIS